MNVTKADFVKGSFVVLASRPAMGKTALALSIADHLARSGDKTILIFSLEMSEKQILFRLQKANGNPNYICKNILIDDSPLMTVNKIHELCKQHTENLGAVIIDYMQLIQIEETPVKAKNRQEEMTYISRGLKEMAKGLNVPVICTSQISKKSEDRWQKVRQIIPVLEDFIDLGAVVQDADQILLLYRDRYYHPDSPLGDMAECIVLKNRYGDIGTVNLKWEPERVAFSKW